MFRFRSSCHICDLHSFPTRRSSDLTFAGPKKSSAFFNRSAPSSARSIYSSITPAPKLPPFMKLQWKSHSINGTDRKSTRLNSSHVETSYAVFCLKKKKQTNDAP